MTPVTAVVRRTDADRIREWMGAHGLTLRWGATPQRSPRFDEVIFISTCINAGLYHLTFSFADAEAAMLFKLTFGGAQA